jgi:hypothetical protein
MAAGSAVASPSRRRISNGDESGFQKWGQSSALWGRFLPALRLVVSIPSGPAQMSPSRFGAFTAVGTVGFYAATGGVIYYGRQRSIFAAAAGVATDKIGPRHSRAVRPPRDRTVPQKPGLSPGSVRLGATGSAQVPLLRPSVVGDIHRETRASIPASEDRSPHCYRRDGREATPGSRRSHRRNTALGLFRSWCFYRLSFPCWERSLMPFGLPRESALGADRTERRLDHRFSILLLHSEPRSSAAMTTTPKPTNCHTRRPTLIGDFGGGITRARPTNPRIRGRDPHRNDTPAASRSDDLSIRIRPVYL